MTFNEIKDLGNARNRLAKQVRAMPTHSAIISSAGAQNIN